MLTGLSWRLGPVLVTVIVTAAVSAFLYRRQTKASEVANATAQVRAAQPRSHRGLPARACGSALCDVAGPRPTAPPPLP